MISPDENSLFKQYFNQLTPEAQAQITAVERALLFAQGDINPQKAELGEEQEAARQRLKWHKDGTSQKI